MTRVGGDKNVRHSDASQESFRTSLNARKNSAKMLRNDYTENGDKMVLFTGKTCQFVTVHSIENFVWLEYCSAVM